jgi:hypothetical protein
MRNRWRSPIGLLAALAVIALGLGVAQAKGMSGHNVVSLLSGGRGLSQSSAEPSPTAAASPRPASQTFQLTGGTVTVTCAGGVITVNDATPNAGFTVEQELKDEGAQAEVRFESATHESRLEVECAGDEIQVEELREEAVEEPAPPAPPAPATTAPPQSMTRTFNLVGGTVTVTCRGNTLTVNAAQANGGFSQEAERKDDGTVVEFRFESSTHKSRLEVGCTGGQVVVEELREEAS